MTQSKNRRGWGVNTIRKFKVWDKQEKCWVPEPVMITGDGVLHIDVADREWMPPGDGDRFIICWITGLHDRNGREIFEGDVIRRRDFHDHTKYDLAAVEWSGHFPEFWLTPKEGSGIYRMSDGHKSLYEIIGNIHQNPELLE